MKIPQTIIDSLTGKKIVLDKLDNREITIVEVCDYDPEDRSVGIFGDIVYCITSEGNEIEILNNGEVYNDKNVLIATIESDYGIQYLPDEPEVWDDDVSIANDIT